MIAWEFAGGENGYLPSIETVAILELKKWGPLRGHE